MSIFGALDLLQLEILSMECETVSYCYIYVEFVRVEKWTHRWPPATEAPYMYIVYA